MQIVIAGGHGQIAVRLSRLLAARGDRARGLIRSSAQEGDVRTAGAEPVVCDLEDLAADVAPALAGADAVVFAAGSGPGSGAERKRTMDLHGALRTIWAARRLGVARYVMISAIRAASPPDDEGDFGAYLRAKAEADRDLRASGLDYTIVRPGWLTDDPGTGRVEVGPALDDAGRISRDDVAAVLLAVLDTPGTIGKTFDVVAGGTPIARAVAGV